MAVKKAAPLSSKYTYGDKVMGKFSGELGEVIGIATYAHQETQYYVRYVNGNGCQHDGWWNESSIRLNK